MRPTVRDRLIDMALLIGAVSQLVPGLWAFVATAGFAGTVAQFDPYNRTSSRHALACGGHRVRQPR